MDLKQAYEFLKPSLDQCTDEEKREFCRMILGEPESEKVKKSKTGDPVMSKAKMKKTTYEESF